MTRKYDVFVSFRGEDTRNNFTDHLYAALHRNGIIAFRDDTNLKKGESIAPELMQAIEGSQVLIVIFSKNYASSTWCLQELIEFLNCVQVSGKHVLPIFYDVDPSEVRKQSGSYDKAFGEHEERFKEDLEKMVEVQRWREALTQVANLSGWDVRDKPQNAEIEKIAKEVINILDENISSLPNDLVGIESAAEELEKLLHLSSVDDVGFVGITGMGGIGKTTLATLLYERISRQYDTCCFIDDVSKVCRDYGPVGVAKQLLCQTLNEENLHVCNLYDATNLIRQRLCHVRALIVLDNVDQVEQLEKLVLNRECLGAGSRIIIISRDKHILTVYGVDDVYNVRLLCCDSSLKLLCRKAFKCDDVRTEYENLAYDALSFANGLPLAIKVLGSFLFGRDVYEWRSALFRLRESSSKDVMDVLRISYDELEEMQKEIFLDIACFFNNKWLSEVKKILDCRGFHPDIGIRDLIDKSLLTVSHDGLIIKMHSLLEELGKQIVRENSPREPRKWSRLWEEEDFYKFTSEDNTESKVEAVVLRDSETLMAEAVSKLNRIRLLIISDRKISGSLSSLSNELRYVLWSGYPFMHLPSSFQPTRLVHLDLRSSSIKQLWEGKKYLPSLKTLDLSNSHNLIKMPDLGGVPNLEWLNLEGCIRLEQIDPSTGLLRKLIFLNLSGCKSLHGCSKVSNNLLIDKLRHAENSKELDISETTMHSQSTSSMVKRLMLLPLQFLKSRKHKDSASCSLTCLPSFSCLRDLNLSFCNLQQIPDVLGSLYCLERLNLEGNNFLTLCSLKELSKLVNLNLSHCKHLKSLPELPSRTYFPSRRDPVVDPELRIFNCPNLDERERCNSMIFSWMKQVFQACQESSAPFHSIEIIIPGSEIPRWFNNQSVGNSISIDSSPIMHHNNWIGVACCAVFVAHRFSTKWTCKDNGPYLDIRFKHKWSWAHLSRLIVPDADLVTVKSDHTWLIIYFPWAESIHLEDIETTYSSFPRQGLLFQMKDFRYNWVSEKDLEQFTEMHSTNSAAPNRKVLAIDDKPQPL
ncbi:disease resistance protein RUN1-like [Gastrolobium bilobum]|uniref:disease resistance protein RUN1-like n=1 Tax=Gastrolobium bilobum TaxID=150636 RepID=UPI002AB01CB6|nr:disease resistance protein RUN1-like [Gastrolobium bilobum]